MRPTVALAAPALAVALATGCVVYEHDDFAHHHTHYDATYTNAPPEVYAGSALVYFEPAYDDDVWSFEAQVGDADGPLDVISVWADVYDEWRGGILVESFELLPTTDPYVWYSEVLGSSTLLDPFYAGYTVDFVAYDTWEDFGWLTVWASTYSY